MANTNMATVNTPPLEFPRQQREKDRVRRVFIVDDNEAQLRTLAALFEDEGFDVLTSEDAHEALDYIASGEFGIAVVDLKMPRLSGIQVLDAIKRQQRTTHVIIHTAHGDFDSARQAVNLGAFAFVEKLGDPAELLSHVHRACNLLLDRYSSQLEQTAAQQSEQLYLSEQRVLTTLNSIAEGVITTDARGTVEYMNPIAEELTGWSLKSALQRPTTDVFRIIDGATREPLDDPAARCLALNRSISALRETILLSRDGIEYWINGSAAPLRDAQQRLIGAVITVKDETARVRAERELRQHQDQLEELVDERTAAMRASLKELDEFAGSVSHDLRSPLRSIDGFSRILLDDYAQMLDDSGKDALHRVRAASQRMGRLIDDLLKLSRISRHTAICRERVDITELAEEIAARQLDHHAQRNIDLECERSLCVIGDPNLLQIALDNLIGNAIKYTAREAHARIRISGKRVGDELQVCVSDNGVGFDMLYADKLFGAFQRLHSDSFEGTGIGLATTARIIERHGGRIWADSVPGDGANFYFTLAAAEGA